MSDLKKALLVEQCEYFLQRASKIRDRYKKLLSGDAVKNNIVNTIIKSLNQQIASYKKTIEDLLNEK